MQVQDAAISKVETADVRVDELRYFYYSYKDRDLAALSPLHQRPCQIPDLHPAEEVDGQVVSNVLASCPLITPRAGSITGWISWMQCNSEVETRV